MKWSTLALVIACAASVLLTVLAVNFLGREKRVTATLGHQYAVSDPQFLRAMGNLLGPAIVGGNRVETLLNGDRIFPSMLEAIRGAKSTITFETYIYWSGDIGRAFAEALSERARDGVKVHVILDWLGSQKMDAASLDEMRQAGVEIRQYHPLKWYHLHRMNNRTHRKLLVVDGRIGFTGGVGIADKWSGNAQDADHWRDTHYRLEGPAVAQMQAVFNDNWIKTTGNVLDGEAYVPQLKPAGDQHAQVFQSSPDGGTESMHLMYLLAIWASTRSIDLSMAYFAPDEPALKALVAAARRGVKVRIILPGPITDAAVVQSSSRAKWGELLEEGAEIWQYQPTMYHCKVLVVDGLWTSVGSTNFDSRSFRLNDEANLNVYDKALAAQQLRDFEEDLKKSRRVTLEEWLARPWHEKVKEKAASLLDSQL